MGRKQIPDVSFFLVPLLSSPKWKFIIICQLRNHKIMLAFSLPYMYTSYSWSAPGTFPLMAFIEVTARSRQIESNWIWAGTIASGCFLLSVPWYRNSMISSARPKWRLVHAGVFFFLFILCIRCHWEKKNESVHLLHRCSKFNIIKIGFSKLSSTSSQKWCYFFSKYNSVLFRWKSANHQSWTSSDESVGK